MKNFKPLYVISSLFIVALIGCADQNYTAGEITPNENDRIVGGRNIKYSDPLAASVVFISTENARGHNEICTGTFISKNLILTAAHCIAKNKDGMSISFRGRDFDKTQNIVDIEIDEAYKLDFTPLGVKRNDMGIIKYNGGLPATAVIAGLPQDQVALGLRPLAMAFTALGYGRNTGMESDDAMAMTGEGVLRAKNLISGVINPKIDYFKIDQYKNKGGICFGDSGGPALIWDPMTRKPVVIGVASAVLTERKGKGINNKDDCQNESMYLNMYFYANHFGAFVKSAMAAKEKQKLALKK